jgi:hypothetical protein
MPHTRIINENNLDTWTRGNAIKAQGVIVELIFRLVAASVPRPKGRRFPLGDSIGQHGADGFLDTDIGLPPFVPDGVSYWEIGTGKDAHAKATNDYRELTKATPEDVRLRSTFVFVTPLSGRTAWSDTWKEEDQSNWLTARKGRAEWNDVAIIDGTRIIDWLSSFPAVEIWLANEMGHAAHELQTPELHWADLSKIGAPPPFTPDVFLVNRDAGAEMLRDVFSGTLRQLRVDTRQPAQMVDFTSAFVAKLAQDERADIGGRCLIISGTDGWNAAISLNEPHVLIANFDLDRSDSAALLLDRANRRGHTVIYSGMPGGVPIPYRVPIPNPNSHQLREVLQLAGYAEERARLLAQKCDGDLTALLRCVQGLSVMPGWAESTEAGNLAIAALLGGWNEAAAADKAVVEQLSGNAYGEWIGKIREVSLRPDTPLSLTDGTWKVGSRYEAWYALGPRIFDEHLTRVREVAAKVLRERDPQFDVSPDERHMAQFTGKVPQHSHTLRTGLAETLALLGNHPKALTSCSFGRAEAAATATVREILTDADWQLWASLNDVLPLLAEASPDAFLSAVEAGLASTPCPFDTLFTQERPGVMGRTYMTGLLWGLESLAWDPELLIRVVVILGELGSMDPGGNWGNRPSNSLTTILLPWLPQTCATDSTRQAAVATLLKEFPNVGWKLLLSLLPGTHQASMGTHRPIWRETIPEGWSARVSQREYWEQVSDYAELAAQVAESDTEKLVTLIDHLHELPSPARRKVLSHLGSDAVTALSEDKRLTIWTALTSLVSKHRRFADAEWAMPPESVDEIASVAELLKPTSPFFRHQRLFGDRDFDLYEERGNYRQLAAKLENDQQSAVREILTEGGINTLLRFARVVEAPWRVGTAFASVASQEQETQIIPALLDAEEKPLAQLAGGFVAGRFRSQEWRWVDDLDTSHWLPKTVGQLFSYLPFVPEAWERVQTILGGNEVEYWKRANANPYEAENGLDHAIECLVKYGRAGAAARCLEGMIHEKKPITSTLATKTLLAILDSPDDARTIDGHALVEIISAIQDDASTSPDEICQIEWAYLPLLDRFSGGSPKLLEQKLADSAAFYCEVVRAAFWSKKEERPAEISEAQRNMAKHAYQLLDGWRIPPGTRGQEPFNSEHLSSWLEEVKSTCHETGHFEAALIMVGHVLTYVPEDPDGLWIHHSAAAALNEKDSESMREGFRTKIFNSRGVHGWSAGREERELAEQIRTRAEMVERHGYFRLATSLRGLATSYDRDAEYDASRGIPGG